NPVTYLQIMGNLRTSPLGYDSNNNFIAYTATNPPVDPFLSGMGKNWDTAAALNWADAWNIYPNWVLAEGSAGTRLNNAGWTNPNHISQCHRFRRGSRRQHGVRVSAQFARRRGGPLSCSRPHDADPASLRWFDAGQHAGWAGARLLYEHGHADRIAG